MYLTITLMLFSSKLCQEGSSGGSGTKFIGEEELKHFEECIDKLQISGYQSVLHADEDEEGEERPDLGLDIRKV